MKNILLLCLLACIMACSKSEETKPSVTQQPQASTGTVTFYMGSINAGANWHLLIDGIDRGKLTASGMNPTCNDSQFITLNLTLGVHTIDSKSFDGYAWGTPVTYNVLSGCNTYKVR